MVSLKHRHEAIDAEDVRPQNRSADTLATCRRLSRTPLDEQESADGHCRPETERDQEARVVYRVPSEYMGRPRPTYDTFEDYFVATMGQSFSTWFEMEAAYHFVRDSAPHLAAAPLAEVTKAKARQEAAAERTRGQLHRWSDCISRGRPEER